jgi:hypothetical protein
MNSRRGNPKPFLGTHLARKRLAIIFVERRGSWKTRKK